MNSDNQDVRSDRLKRQQRTFNIKALRESYSREIGKYFKYESDIKNSEEDEAEAEEKATVKKYYDYRKDILRMPSLATVDPFFRKNGYMMKDTL